MSTSHAAARTCWLGGALRPGAARALRWRPASRIHYPRTDVTDLRAEMHTRFEGLEKTVADGNAALLSAVLQLARR